MIEGLQALTHLEKARRFCTDVLGLEEDCPVPNLTRAAFQLPGASARLTRHIQSPGEGWHPPGTASGSLCYASDSEAACRAIREKGGTILSEPFQNTRGGRTFTRGVCADRDGNEFLLSTPF